MFSISGSDIVITVSNGGAVLGLIATAFWQADNFIGETARRDIVSHLYNAMDNPNKSVATKRIMQFYDHYLSPKLPWSHFLFNVLIFTSISMFTLLLLYLAQLNIHVFEYFTPGTESTAFWTAFFMDGFLKVFLVNYIAFSIGHYFLHRLKSFRVWVWLMAIVVDIFLKIVLFLLLTIISYYFFARLGLRFSGNTSEAINSVMPTLMHGLPFNNLSAVYLYSISISSLPLYVILTMIILANKPNWRMGIDKIFYWLPLSEHPIRLAAIGLGLVFGIFMSAATIFIRVFSYVGGA